MLLFGNGTHYYFQCIYLWLGAENRRFDYYTASNFIVRFVEVV